MDERPDLPDPRPDVTVGAGVGEAGAEPEPAVEEASGERTYPSTVGGMAYLLMLLVACAAVVVVVVGDWRVGVRIFSGVLLAGALLRIALPTRDAGMLAVRSKGVDAALLGGVGTALLVLASSIPDQPV